MNIKLQHQKMQIQIALNYLNLVEICEENISLGVDVVNSVLRKKDYADKYVEIMSNIVEDAITISTYKIELFNES